MNASRERVRDVRPTPPHGLYRRSATATRGYIRIATSIAFALVLLSTSCATEADRKPPEVELAESWVEAVADGRLGEARALTHGEFGEPEALTGFAEEITTYTNRYGQPKVSVGHDVHEASSPELSFVCVRFDFGDVVRDGGLALRSWDDLGLRVWEFRDGMEGCASSPSAVTTTRPSLPSDY